PSVFNTDCGSQYTSGEFIELLKSYNVEISMDRIFDDALIFNLRGNSYRGKECESYSLTTIRGKATNAELPAVK
ncbi:MAG: IS3 family transposase, partial [Methanobrevibacter sp.]